MIDRRLEMALGKIEEAAPGPASAFAAVAGVPVAAEAWLAAIPDGICGVDAGGRVLYANPAAARLLGRDAAKLVGAGLHDLLHGAAPDDLTCATDCALRELGLRWQPESAEDSFYRPGGISFPVEFTLSPVEGHPGFSILSFRDIGERAAVDRIKDEFVSTVSHELRTPLTSIRGALGLLSGGMLGPVNDKAANLLRIALTNSERLVRLINDILDLERIQSGKEPLSFRTVELSELVRQAIDGMAPMADAVGVKLLHDAVQAEVAADADRILQVLTNLLSNAVKFSPANSSVSVMLRPGNSGVTLSVIDNGRGIEAERLSTIFDRFNAFSDTGTGMGLALVRRLVESLGGQIAVESRLGHGTTFRFTLPVAVVDVVHHPVEVG